MSPIYKRIAELGNKANELPEKEANKAWDKAVQYVNCWLVTMHKASKVNLKVASWKKIVIELTYAGNQYIIIVLPSLTGAYMLKVVGPNRNNNKEEITNAAIKWLESEV